MKKEFLIRAGLVIFCLLFFGFRVAQLGYSVPDEKRYIQSIKEMVEGGDWVTPHYYGKKRFEKPILFYWLGSLSSILFGTGIYGARFPSILFGSLTVLLVYLLGLELFGRRAGLVSGLFLATSGMFYMYSRFATPDATLVFFMTLSIYFFIKGYKNLGKPDTVSFYLFFFSAALAGLTKGPVGPLLILLVTSVFIIYYGNFFSLLRNMRLGRGVLIFLITVLPWFLIMIRLHGSEYTDHIWRVETLQRVSEGINFSNLIKAAIRYILVIIFANLAVSLFLPSAIIETVRSKFKNRKETLFLLGWLASVFLFFTFIGTKKMHYMLAASPPLALLIGQVISSKKEDVYKDLLFKIPIFLIIIVSTFGLTAIFILINYISGAMPWICYFAIAAPLILIWAWAKRGDFAVFFISGSVIWMLFLMGLAIPTLDNQPLLKFAGVIEPKLEEGDIVGVGSHVISHNRLSRYLDRKVKKVNIEHQDSNAHLRENRARLLAFLTKKERVFCVVTKEDFLRYVPQSLKRQLYILARADKWKKTNKINFDRALIAYFLSGKRELFIDKVREEILLVTNKP